MNDELDQPVTAVLVEFARILGTEFSIQIILDHLVTRIVELLPITGAGVMLMGPEQELHFVAASNDTVLAIEKLQNDLIEGPCLDAYRTGRAVAITDLHADKRFPHFSPRASSAGLAAVFTFPLRLGDRRLGALDLYRDMAGALSDRDLKIAQVLADVAAGYLVNAQTRADAVAAAEQLHHQNLHDQLTGLANRTLLVELLDRVLAVNVSASQVMGPAFAHMVKEVLQDTGADPAAICLEVTESLFLAEADRAVTVLKEVKDLGVQLSLDDFGTGYSSLSYLRHLPVDVVKIDRSFTGNLTADDATRAIVRAVIDLSHVLKMTVVAEGVETADEPAQITTLGADYAQGYHFSRPLPKGKLADFITGRPPDARTVTDARPGKP